MAELCVLNPGSRRRLYILSRFKFVSRLKTACEDGAHVRGKPFLKPCPRNLVTLPSTETSRLISFSLVERSRVDFAVHVKQLRASISLVPEGE